MNQSKLNIMEILVFFILLLLIFLYLIPDLGGIKDQLLMPLQNSDWDSDSIMLWGYAHDSGLIENKDFWFPYAGTIVFLGKGILAIELTFLYKLFIYQLFSISLVLITRNIYLTGILVLVIFIGENSIVSNLPIIWGASRYLLSISLVLSFILYLENKNLIYKKIPFLLLLVMGLNTYHDQLILSFIPILFISLYYFLFSEEDRIKKKIKFLISSYSPILIILIIYLIFLYKNEKLNNYFQFYSQLGSNIVYSTEPTRIANFLRNFFSYQFLIISIPSVIFGLTILKISNKSIKFSISSIDLAILSINILLINVLMKYSSRDMSYQLTIYPLILIFLYIASNNTIIKPIKYIIYILISFFIYYSTSQISYIYNKTNLGFEYFINNIKQWEYKSEGVEHILTKYNYKQLLNDPNKRLIIEKYQGKNIYVLGEPSMLYILTNNKIPWNSSFYDGSPLYQQNKMVEFLKSQNNLYIFINKKNVIFDMVPNIVRVPILYDHIIKNYKFKESIGDYDILIHLDKGENPDIKYWISTLGSSINLGNIPRLSSVNKFNACKRTDSNCIAFLNIYKKNIDCEIDKIDKIGFDDGNLKFELNLFKNTKIININLSKIWFWEFININNLKISGINNCSFNFIMKEKNDSILY